MKIQVEFTFGGTAWSEDPDDQIRHILGEPWHVDTFRFGSDGQVATIGECVWVEPPPEPT